MTVDYLCGWPSPPLVSPQHLWLPRYAAWPAKSRPRTAAEEAKYYCLQQRWRTTTKNTTAAAQRWAAQVLLGALVQPEPPPPAGAGAAPPSRSRRVDWEFAWEGGKKMDFHKFTLSHICRTVLEEPSEPRGLGEHQPPAGCVTVFAGSESGGVEHWCG